MPLYRCQVALHKSTDVVRDHIVNTFYLRKNGAIGVGDNTLALDATALWDGVAVLAGFDRITCRLYDMADAPPRRVVAQHTRTTATHTSEPGPREVALCLSYHGERNLPSLRGRMYMGPFPPGNLTTRPAAPTRAALITLGQGLSSLGGVDVDHVVYSPKNKTESKVTRIWVDDEWDTQRSRGLRASTRSTADVSG